MKRLTKDEFMKEYLNAFPEPTLIGWLEDFANQLDKVEEPNPRLLSHEEYYKRLGAYETQELIVKKLRDAIDFEKKRSE